MVMFWNNKMILVTSENDKNSSKNDQVITLTQDQLTKLLGMVVNSTETSSIPVNPQQPAVQDPIPVPTGTKIESVPDDMEPVNALKILQNQNLENSNPLANSTLNEIPKEQIRKMSRDEQLAESQKNIPLQMRSSFLPYEAVPRDILAEQRKQKQMEWRRELEKQRRDDEERKKAQKDKEKKEMLPDHHLFQSGNHPIFKYHVRRDLMILTFHEKPPARRQGLCDIGGV